ncbi:DUF2922 domain-containing protein [Salinicoccus albus]|uniref:DUF2922 domain-containing protein n=1 Tax=Salinicoccus albus TaxID=418756 RepID=UPI000362B51C|nr:DUF2922 domain-containing protein [Salinicoccus albus]
MTRKLTVVFNTELGRRFTLNINNPADEVTEELLLAEAQKMIDTNALAPMQGKPVSVHSAKIVEQHVTEII